MTRKIGLAGLAALWLCGCGTGYPWGRSPDPHAAGALAKAAPLIAECQRQFAGSIAPASLALIGGPDLTETGTHTFIHLTAQPVAVNAIDNIGYSCDFEGGRLSGAER